MKLAIGCLLLCCVMQAAGPQEESNPMFVAPPGLADARAQWTTKIETYLKDEGQVRVFYFPKAKECYSARYDVRSSKVDVVFTLGSRVERLIVPLLYSLQQGILRGYVLKSGCFEPGITGTDFFVDNVDSKNYDLRWFFSQDIECFLTECCPKLEEQDTEYVDHDEKTLAACSTKPAKQDKEHVDHDEKTLTSYVVKTELSKRRFKRFAWKVVLNDDAWKVWQAKKESPQVLFIVGGAGMLWGRLTNRVFGDVAHGHECNLLYYKLKSALDSMCAKYPFSEKELRSCLNYTAVKMNDLWREAIRMDLAAEGQGYVGYFPKKNGCVGVVFNVQSKKVITSYGPQEKRRGVTLPMEYFLQQEFLKGYVLKPGRSEPNVSSIDFSDKDVDLKNYDHQQFFSRGLDYVLTEFFPKLVQKGVCLVDGQGKLTRGELTTDMFRKMLLNRTDEQPFCWNIMSEEGVLAQINDIKEMADVLLIIGGVGILWGRLTDSLYQDVPTENSRSLHCYKMSRVLDDICAKYPSSTDQ